MYAKVYVEITNVCNLRCSFCHGHSRPPRQMSREEFSRVLEQLQGKTEFIYYHLMGEPLIHPQLPVFLEMAAEAGFRSIVTTNGTLLDRLPVKNLHKVNVSLHSFEGGSRELHEAYIRKIADFAQVAADASVLVSLRLWNEGHDGGCNKTAIDCLRRYFPGQWTENTRGYRICDRIFLEGGQRFAWPDMDAPEGDGHIVCYGLRDHFGILCDGTVVPCCLDSEGAIPLGNVFTQDLEQILENSRARAIVTGFSQRKASEPLCRRCGYARRF